LSQELIQTYLLGNWLQGIPLTLIFQQTFCIFVTKNLFLVPYPRWSAAVSFDVAGFQVSQSWYMGMVMI
jgi:hypothetical protein